MERNRNIRAQGFRITNGRFVQQELEPWRKCSPLMRCCSKQMLLLLSGFRHVQLCVTLEMAAHQASLFLGFSRQEHWSGLPFPSPMHESEK